MVVVGLAAPDMRATAVPAPDHGPTAGGTKVSDTVPSTNFTQVDAGSGPLLSAIDGDNNAYAWGGNGSGALRFGLTGDQASPVQIDTLPSGVRAKQVAMSSGRLLVLATNGTAYISGTGGQAQFADASIANGAKLSPVPMPAGVTFTQISADYTVSAAIGSDGNAYTWGTMGYGVSPG